MLAKTIRHPYSWSGALIYLYFYWLRSSAYMAFANKPQVLYMKKAALKWAQGSKFPLVWLGNSPLHLSRIINIHVLAFNKTNTVTDILTLRVLFAFIPRSQLQISRKKICYFLSKILWNRLVNIPLRIKIPLLRNQLSSSSVTNRYKVVSFASNQNSVKVEILKIV